MKGTGDQRSLGKSTEQGRAVERGKLSFPSQEEEGWTRRQFMEWLAASMLLGGVGLSGCRRPEEVIVPYAHRPEGYHPDRWRWYATALPRTGGAVPVLAACYEGRPIKLEPNPTHPVYKVEPTSAEEPWGGIDAGAQAAVLDLYDPDRAHTALRDGQPIVVEAVWDWFRSRAAEWRRNGGRGLAVVVRPEPSPTRDRWILQLQQQWPEAKWLVWNPLSSNAEAAWRLFAGSSTVGMFLRIDRARRILGLEADFLGREPQSWVWARQFAAARQSGPVRLYQVESVLSPTGIVADHRLALSPAECEAFALVLLWEALEQGVVPEPGRSFLQSFLDPKKLSEKLPDEARAWARICLQDLIAHRQKALVIAGHESSLLLHIVAGLLNHWLGAVGRTVEARRIPKPPLLPGETLREMILAGEVQTLVLMGVNPAWTAPAGWNWNELARRVPEICQLAPYFDETTSTVQWFVPQAHPLECWGDGWTADGTWTIQQPMLQPLFHGVSELEFLQRMTGAEQVKVMETVQQTLATVSGTAGKVDEVAWRAALRNGFYAGKESQPVPVRFQTQAALQRLKQEVSAFLQRQASRWEWIFLRDPRVQDGTWANNGWLLELPDPVCQSTWSNAVFVSPQTASALNLPFQEETDSVQVPQLRLRLPTGEWVLPVVVVDGMAEGTLATWLGWGRERIGRIGQGRGVNLFPARPNLTSYRLVPEILEPAGTGLLPRTQRHHQLTGHPLAQQPVLALQQVSAETARQTDRQVPSQASSSKASFWKEPIRWAMVIDLDRCIGCGACIVACQAENNIPVVGPEEVLRGREMQWLRVDRYEQLHLQDEEPRWRFLPIPCQHCEKAPCELVCPVHATVHDAEGLNLMIYNRCIGARYCSNNCPYKVRRFNFFDYQRPIRSGISDKAGQGSRMKGSGLRPPAAWEKEWKELLRLRTNPEVTVRSRGVMEKCTFCLQRIERARIAQKLQALGQGEAESAGVEETVPIPACAQTCPTGAIVFGNLTDPSSKVAQLWRSERAVALLEGLGTEPRVRYLKRRWNPNPALLALGSGRGSVSKNGPGLGKQGKGEPQADGSSSPSASSALRRNESKAVRQGKSTGR